MLRHVPLALAGVLLIASACSDSPNAPRIPTEVVAIVGEDQIGTAGAQLPLPVVIAVLDANERPIPNQPVVFVVTGGGSLQNVSARTDGAGLAQAFWTLGTNMMDEQRLDVHAVASPSSTTPLASTSVYATAGPAAPASLVIVSPNPQAHWAGATLGIPPSVRVLDAFGNAVAGAEVNFAVTGGNGTLTNPSVTSGANGIATVGSWTLGAVGTNTVVASSGTLTPVTFTANAKSLTPASIELSAGQNQTATVATQVPVAPAVLVRNAAGDALPGITVTFTPGPNSGSVHSTTATTGTNGIATSSAWFLGNVAGAQTLVASAGPATFTFNAQATAGSPRQLEKTAGDAQVAAPGATLPIRPAVIVRDAFGNVVPNVTVRFDVYNGGGSISETSAVSNAAGLATGGSWTLGPLSGTQTLRATAAGANDTDFTAKARLGVATLITAHHQNPTSAIPGSEITLGVIVLDDVGEPLAGVPISFAPITSHFGQGTVLFPSQNVATNAQGVATVRYVMPTNVYAFGGVTATGSGLQPLTMTVLQTVGTPKEIRVTLPSDPVIAGGDLGRPEFSVVDQYGTALPMVPVTFTVVTGGGLLDGSAVVIEKTVATAAPPATTATGPLWTSGPMAGVNTLVVSMPMLPEVPSVVIRRTTLPPP